MKKLFVLMFVAVFGSAVAAEPPAKADPRAAIAKKFPGTKAEDVRPSPVPGVYEVQIGADTMYVSADGRYAFAGDLFEVDTRTNLTEANRSVGRTKLLAKLDERDMIVFGPASAKHTITVFTDVECGYCRKLHGEIDQLNKLGVRVRYLAYPRAGPGSDDWRKMEAVWCSAGPQDSDHESQAGPGSEGAELRRDAGREAVQAGRRHGRSRDARHLHGQRRLHWRLLAARHAQTAAR